MTTKTSSRPTHRVSAVIKKAGAEKGQWHEIGALWPHKDGKGFNLKLNLLPTGNADLIIRAVDANDTNTADQAEGGEV